MSHGDFSLEDLAVYLHLAPQQVEKLAGRGELPGRKIRGEWRFSRADIHHWMEDRMGLLDDDALQRVETNLDASSLASHPQTVAELLTVERIAVPLRARTKSSVIFEMVELAARSGMLWDVEQMVEAVRQREELQSTALDNGVALLHPRRPLASILEEPHLALGVTGQGIPFGGSRSLTDVFFLICSTDDRGHLRALARISRLLANPDFLPQLREATTAEAAYRIIEQTESVLSEPAE